MITKNAKKFKITVPLYCSLSNNRLMNLPNLDFSMLSINHNLIK